MNSERLTDTWPLVAGAAVWAPAMIAASYEWIYGDYYDYGWFVPPAAAWLAICRWRETNGTVRRLRLRWVALSVVMLLPWILVLRVLGYTDPSWRLPIGLLGLTAVLFSHGWIAATRGWRVSVGFVWITLLLVSALPWPSVIESGIVRWLTGHVVGAVAEVFQLIGRPVEIMGDRLALHDLTVEVTDGCSGVRSFQSFMMATWFFAELQRLRTARVLVLLGCACAIGFVVNMARTFLLAEIRFVHGQSAFERAHDILGIAAFAVSGVLFYVLSGWLAVEARRLVRTRCATSP